MDMYERVYKLYVLIRKQNRADSYMYQVENSKSYIPVFTICKVSLHYMRKTAMYMCIKDSVQVY